MDDLPDEDLPEEETTEESDNFEVINEDPIDIEQFEEVENSSDGKQETEASEEADSPAELSPEDYQAIQDDYEEYIDDLAEDAARMQEMGNTEMAEADREEMRHTQDLLFNLVKEKNGYE